jgi:tRNA(Ile)-lysidine synthase
MSVRAAASETPAADLATGLLARCAFPDPGTAGRVALAVSGGPDSLALVILAAYAGLDAVAIHVDHGLRPGSQLEADAVAEAAGRYGLAFESRHVVVPPGPDLEARARSARYDVLPPGVITGHTMDDQAETVILNMLRGAGLDGLCGMRSDGHGIGARRPLLGLRRFETAALCASEGLEPVADPSNADPRFRRNRVRHEVLPLLCDVAGRDVVPILARQAAILEADRAHLEALAGDIDPTDARALRAAPPALATRALRRWLRAPAVAGPEQHPPSAAEVTRLMEVVLNTARACELSGGRRVERSGGRLRVTVRAGSAGPAVPQAAETPPPASDIAQNRGEVPGAAHTGAGR